MNVDQTAILVGFLFGLLAGVAVGLFGISPLVLRFMEWKALLPAQLCRNVSPWPGVTCALDLGHVGFHIGTDLDVTLFDDGFVRARAWIPPMLPAAVASAREPEDLHRP